MEQQAKFQAICNGEIYQLRTGAHAFIFDCGLFWEMDKYGNDEFMRYVDFVYECYLEMDGPVPLGSLSDYIAEKWEEINKNLVDIYQAAKDFWNQLV